MYSLVNISPTSYSRELSLQTRLLSLLESITELPNQEVAKQADCLSSLSSQASKITAEAITIIIIRAQIKIFSGVLHSIFEKIKIVSAVIHTYSQVGTCCCKPFDVSNMHALHVFIYLMPTFDRADCLGLSY